MKQTMKWLFLEEQGNSVVFRCSVCNSEIIVQYGEELPYCKHCESEPEEEQIAGEFPSNEEMKKRIGHARYNLLSDECRETLDLLEALWDRFNESRCSE